MEAQAVKRLSTPAGTAWNRREVLALASRRCYRCAGAGLLTRGGPCSCVLRAIFRLCLARFREQSQRVDYAASLRSCEGGRAAVRSYSRPNDEFRADFLLVARRHLEPLEYELFRLHYILGGDWRLCDRKLKLGQTRIFQLCYQIEQKLGRVYSELRPYSLYPLGRYFAA